MTAFLDKAQVELIALDIPISATVQESPSAIAAPPPLPDQVARRYESNRQGQWKVRVSARTSR
jgi:hypothetical protein